jgi:ornithine decarboxylase
MVGSYYVLDLDFLDQAMDDWKSIFPTIKPYYAVKCNPHPLIIERLVKLGAGFDCASLSEIELVRSKGSTDILYANPCKHPDELQRAFKLGISRTTFDSISELYKISRHGPMDLILRIRADDPKAKCQLGNKYGAEEHEWPELMRRVSEYGLNLIGISFHVGSGASSEGAYIDGIKKSLRAVQLAITYGFDIRLVDIGGGFTHGRIPNTNNLTDYLQGFEIIAEPGRFFAEKVATLYTPVIGYKDGSVTIDESLYGSFGCRIFDHATPVPIFSDTSIKKPKTLFGCTCDGIDVIYENILLPDLSLGDVIEWPNMGAYTMAATTAFNGMPFHKRKILLK